MHRKGRFQFEITYVTPGKTGNAKPKRIREILTAHKNLTYSEFYANVKKRVENLSLDGCSIRSVTPIY